MRSDDERALLLRVGGLIRRHREALGLTRADLAAKTELSVRFLAQVESGEGNPALTRLLRIAKSLDVKLERLLAGGDAPTDPSHVMVVALVGLRGAGKSTLGRRLAKSLEFAFLEHDQLVEDESGMDVATLFALHGEEFYRRAASAGLTRFLNEVRTPTVLATSGGVVTQARSWAQLRRRCLTVWLSATPDDHWDRVIAQGDQRPMANRPNAMDALRRLLASREPLYAEANLTLPTSTLTVEAAASALETMVRPRLASA